MGQVIAFRRPPLPTSSEQPVLGLMSAVDFALRDLAEIMPHITLDAAREQAEACRAMLADAFNAEVEAELGH
jgi:hypothetical protein